MKSNKKGLVIAVLSVIGILSVFGVINMMKTVNPYAQFVAITDENQLPGNTEKVKYDKFINVEQEVFTSNGLEINWADYADGAEVILMSVVSEEPQDIQFRSNLTGEYTKVSDTVYYVMLDRNKDLDKAFFEIVSNNDTIAASNMTLSNN